MDRKLSRVFILGNGESRKDLNLDTLSLRGNIYGCNALYRDYTPHALICVDAKMIHEVYSSGYCSNNTMYARGWTKLPESIYSDMTNLDSAMGWIGSLKNENEKGNRTQFVFNGTDPNQMKLQYENIVKKHGITHEDDQIRIKKLMGNHQQWITWIDDEDCVEQIPVEIEGWGAGPIATRIALEQENPDEVFLIGFDMSSADGKVNNLYKGTSNYVSSDAPETLCGNWIEQHAMNFSAFPNTKFWKVNPTPLGSDPNSRFIEGWRDFDNVEYLDFTDLNLVLDFSIFL